jgi:hypothetical protein
VKRGSEAVARRLGRRRWVWPVATAAGLVLVGRVLVGEVGSPVRLLRALGDLGGPWADPVAAMISLLALLAETLVAYILVALALRALCLLPGSVGRVAWRVTLLVTPVVVRRLLDLLVGGALLAQATLATTSGMPSGHRAAVPALAIATSSVSGGPAAPATGYDLGPPATGHDLGPPGIRPARPRQAATDPAGTRPAPRRSSAPPPPWLGGGPSNPPPVPTGGPGSGSTGEAARRPTGKAEPGSRGETDPGSAGRAGAGYTVAVGDTLWDIAAARLVPGERTVLNVHRYWRQVYRANRRAVGVDPDLIHPGTRLDVPPFRRDRR